MTDKTNKHGDEAAEKQAVKHTPDSAKQDGVIDGQQNQDVHNKAFETTHQRDIRPRYHLKLVSIP